MISISPFKRIRYKAQQKAPVYDHLKINIDGCLICWS